MLPRPKPPDETSASWQDVLVGLLRSYRTWVAVAVGVVAVVGVLLWGANRPDDPEIVDGNGGRTAATPADGLEFDEVFRMIGERCFRLLVAESDEERTAGLRFRESELERVDGMLFAFEGPTEGAFTMSEVVEPLEIGFYGPDGGRRGGHTMEPCPASVSECPSYRAPEPFQYAVETKPGRLPDGPLGGDCEP